MDNKCPELKGSTAPVYPIIAHPDRMFWLKSPFPLPFKHILFLFILPGFPISLFLFLHSHLKHLRSLFETFWSLFETLRSRFTRLRGLWRFSPGPLLLLFPLVTDLFCPVALPLCHFATLCSGLPPSLSRLPALFGGLLP
jgi:hypothetical protein